MTRLARTEPAWLTELRQGLAFLWPQHGDRRIRCVAASGSGKTVLESIIAWFDWYQMGLPVIVLDPAGTLVDLLFGYLTLLPHEKQRPLYRRIKYIDMGSPDFISPTPLYYRTGNESLYEIANRYPEAIRRLSPQLEASAPIMGMAAIQRLNDVAMFLAATGRQIDEAESVIRNPLAYKNDILAALKHYPDQMAATAKKLLEDFPKPKTWEYETMTTSFLAEIMPFSRDPVMRARYSASSPGFSWDEVVENRTLLLLDMHTLSQAHRRFTLVWFFMRLMEYIDSRPNYPDVPLSLIIDEMAYFINQQVSGQDLLAGDFATLLNEYSRKKAVLLTLCHQERHQTEASAQMTKNLLTPPIQIFGRMSDHDAAIETARAHIPYDPFWLHYEESVYQQVDDGHYIQMRVIDYRQHYYSPEQQDRMNARRFFELQPFHFLVSVAGGKLTPLTIAAYTKYLFNADRAVVAEAREAFLKRDGRPRHAILEEIADRQGNMLRETTGTVATSDDDDAEDVIPSSEPRRPG